MSARKPRLVLSERAERDFQDILVYTEQQGGKAQRRAYRQAVIEAFTQLQNFPALGTARPDLGQRTRAYRVGQHVIIYAPTENEILVVRLIHVRRAFNPDLGENT